MDYTRWDTDIYLDFSEYLQLFEGFPSRSASGSYNASLIYNNKKPALLQFSIFYESRFFIEERLEYLQEHGISILSLIKPERVKNKWEHPDFFDFSTSRLIEMRDNPGGWEHGKRVVELIIDNVDVFVNSSYVHHGAFQLTKNSIYLIWKALSYTYKFSSSDWDGKLIDSDDNRNTQFGNFTFTLKIEHSYGNSDKFNLNITRTPYLYIEARNEDITDTEIIAYGNLLCLLMSFYSCRRIDYFNGHARIINNVEFRTHKFFKYSDWTVDDTENFLLQSTYPLFYDFIDDISYSQAIFCSTLLEDIIPPIIQSKYVDESSQYMLLYNVIEKIRNFCLSNNIPGKRKFSIKEEYSFTKTGETLRKALKAKIQAISELIIDDEKEEYLNKANDKVSFMKKTGLKDQFDSLIGYLGIDVNGYEIDFKDIVKIRNSLYHGGIVNLNTVKEYNPILRQIVNDLVLSLLK